MADGSSKKKYGQNDYPRQGQRRADPEEQPERLRHRITTPYCYFGRRRHIEQATHLPAKPTRGRRKNPRQNPGNHLQGSVKFQLTLHRR